MNEIRYHQGSSTFSHVLTVGLMTAHLMNGAHAQFSEQIGNKAPLLYRPYYVSGNSDTYTNYSHPITGTYEAALGGFEQTVSRFYARLLEEQEPLGSDFEQVLYDNLWDLYES